MACRLRVNVTLLKIGFFVVVETDARISKDANTDGSTSMYKSKYVRLKYFISIKYAFTFRNYWLSLR